ncbi:cyclase family protein [Tropicibacter sp. Alg240-R139]|uniref:cyclase family protein n=1 Tax=Tropicibacter sp. Alg240-R139 TaxID=2305991 RepID=UPI0013DEEEAB|nr:cyclase family protein [Tropicibacter sp. Alg240-R139]
MAEWVDLSFDLNPEMWIYSAVNYSDPPFGAMKWTDSETSRYEVWALSMGTQMGTHMDAPCHFVPGAATMDAFDPQLCVGRFRRVDVARPKTDMTPEDWVGVTHLLLDARTDHLTTVEVIEALLALPVPIWVMAGGVRVDHPDDLWFHQRIAEAGKFLVEDLNSDDAGVLPDEGEIVATPLKLTGLSGSPTRVLIRGNS